MRIFFHSQFFHVPSEVIFFFLFFFTGQALLNPEGSFLDLTNVSEYVCNESLSLTRDFWIFSGTNDTYLTIQSGSRISVDNQSILIISNLVLNYSITADCNDFVFAIGSTSTLVLLVIS